MKEPNGYLYPFEAAFWALMAALGDLWLELILLGVAGVLLGLLFIALRYALGVL